MSFTQKMRRALLKESKLEEMEQIAEISRHEAENIMDWFGDDTSLLSFDQLFDGKLRRVINLRSQDAINLQKVVQYLRAEDWNLPKNLNMKKRLKSQSLILRGTGRSRFRRVHAQEKRFRRLTRQQCPRQSSRTRRSHKS